MSSRRVLVDTSVWIEFFNRPGSEHHGRVAELLEMDRVATCGVVVAELIRGCRTAGERDDVEGALEGLLFIEVQRSDWAQVGRDLFDLRRRGKTIALSDAAVAQAARKAACSVYSLDADFDAVPGLERYP
jgi:predicted nucleic acid-binding protein